MLTRAQCRAIDRHAIEDLGIPGVVLMENAGRECAQLLLADLRVGGLEPGPTDLHHATPNANLSKQAIMKACEDQVSRQNLGAPGTAALCCGSGNNGGDGFVIARHLHLAGWSVKVILFASRNRYRDDALVNLNILDRLKVPLVEFDPDWSETTLGELLSSVAHQPVQWIVDALLGTGATGTLSEPFRLAVQAINLNPARRIAIDLPTGMDCDSGIVKEIAIQADTTCTLVDQKAGFGNPQARKYLGTVITVGIGAPNIFAN